MIYLDTSALVKLFITEPGANEVRSLVRDQSSPLPFWEVQSCELANTFQLKVFHGGISQQEADELLITLRSRQARGLFYMPDVGRLEIWSTFDALTRETTKLGTRTLDILHVACAVQLKPDLFVSFDQRQNELARTAGLKVWTPDGA